MSEEKQNLEQSVGINNCPVFSKSILFISFHKCATSHISKNVLIKSAKFKYVDYQSNAYISNRKINLTINRENYIYGVIRILEPIHPLYKMTSLLISKKNIRNNKAIFMIRDPRDILVSMYYSFGFVHGFSANDEIKCYQIKRREIIQCMTIDDYVLAYCDEVAEKFQCMSELIKDSNDYVLLKYEDMIMDFQKFYSKLNSFICLDDDCYESFYKETRPRLEEDQTQHKRSGKVNDYRDKLKPSTIKELSERLGVVLEKFNY